jgi:hypothetical protein
VIYLSRKKVIITSLCIGLDFYEALESVMTEDNTGSNQTGPPCKQLSEQGSTLSYQLTLNEWQHCHGNLDKSNPEGIVDKAQLLPQRFHNLFEDILAWQVSQSLSDQIDWEVIWKELIDLQPRPTARTIDDRGLPHGPDQNVINQRNFGIELGRIVRFLCQSGGGDKRVVLKGLIRGLMIDESKRVDPDDVRYNATKRGPLTELDTDDDRVHPDNKEALEQVPEVASEIQSELQSQTFLSEHAKTQINTTKQAIEFPSLCTDAALESTDITPTTTATHFVQDRMEFNKGLVPQPDETRQKRLNQAQKIAEELKENEPIQTAEDLADLISQDMETLRNEKGSKGWIIFREIAGAKGSIAKASLIDGTDISKTEIGYILAKISGQKEPDERWLRGQQWSDRPVISEVGDDNWKTTPLGDLIYDVAHKTTTLNPDAELQRDKITEQLHRHILEDGYELSSADEWLNRLRPPDE